MLARAARWGSADGHVVPAWMLLATVADLWTEEDEAGGDVCLTGSAGFVSAAVDPVATGWSDPLPGGICTR